VEITLEGDATFAYKREATQVSDGLPAAAGARDCGDRGDTGHETQEANAKHGHDDGKLLTRGTDGQSTIPLLG
jgi:hypothetical protein